MKNARMAGVILGAKNQCFIHVHSVLSLESVLPYDYVLLDNMHKQESLSVEGMTAHKFEQVRKGPM